ncbi:hypothetical protein [Streptomyces sp. CoH17]|uniref:hypothetical protein n=1 Tax=Streptomyces sp. CoH17 TaxID=2992806 RepID=UPI00226FCF7C|nr:hypothetical protein [Streptomyces sp. CoH17]
MPATDEERAADLRAFYGLDSHVFDPRFLDANGLDVNGRHYVLSPGVFPTQAAQEDCATHFEYKVRNRLRNLTQIDRSKNAGPLEKAALVAAGLPLTEHRDGTWNIDKEAVYTEARFLKDIEDQGNAINVRKFYGLNAGSTAILPKGYLPIGTARPNATQVEIDMRFHLNELASRRHTAGKYEAAALRAAGMPMIEYGDDRWIIDKKAARKESALIADAEDKRNAESIMAFYGLDGKSPAIGERGVLPSKDAASDASEDEKSMREHLHKLARRDLKGAGPQVKAALEAAGLKVTKNKHGGYSIDKRATSKAYRDRPKSSQVAGLSQGMGQMSIAAPVAPSSYPVSVSSWDTSAMQGSAGHTGGFGYPVNPAGPAWEYLPTDQRYTQAGSSSQAGPSSYGGPPSHQQAGRQSKRGPK